ncbi:MAG: hypothetical protein KC543_10490 [Myxococcales bacterium]|nr:hypothetical protein [Myxococcales bacterium]
MLSPSARAALPPPTRDAAPARTARAALAAAIGALALATAGCSCNHLVPFGLDAGAPTAPAKTPGAPSAEAPPPGAPSTPPAPPAQSQDAPKAETFATPVPQLDVGDAKFSLTEGGVAAALITDLDDDGDQDAVLARVLPDGSLTLLVATRGPDGFSLAPLATVDPPAPDAKLATSTSPTPAVAPDGAGHPSAPDADAPVRAVSLGPRFGAFVARFTSGDEALPVAVALRLDQPPRVLERWAVLPADGRVPGAVSLAVRGADADGDGHVDLVATVALAPPQGPPSSVDLVWLDRPSGLSLSPDEPEQSIATLADQARGALGNAPGDALDLADRALQLRAALCASSPRARLQVGSARGVRCPRSKGAALATAVRAAALAKAGALLDALDAQRALDRPGLDVTDKTRAVVEGALTAAAQTEGVGLRKLGPLAAEVDAPLSMRDDDTLLVYTSPARKVDLATGASSWIVRQLVPPIHDPLGRFTVGPVRRGCDGYFAPIIDAALGPQSAPLGHALIEPVEPPSGVRCPPTPSSFAQDTGGWSLLGWAPQGLVAVRGAEVRVAPLDAHGHAAGPSFALRSGALAPAPIAGPAITPDGRIYARALPAGLLVQTLGPGGGARLIRPEGWAALEGSVEALALAPSGRRAVAHKGAALYVLDW